MNDDNNFPVVILQGPSGVGKTTLANWVSDDMEFVHIDLDAWDEDTKEIKTIKNLWADLKKGKRIREFKRFMHDFGQNHSGVILTIPGDDMLVNLEVIEKLENEKVHIVILFAKPELCRNAFRERELGNDRNLPVEHWDKYNTEVFKEGYLTKEHQKYMLSTFDVNGSRLGRRELVEDLRKRLYSL